MDIQTGVHTEQYLIDFFTGLLREQNASDYVAVRFNICGMRTINDQVGMEIGTQLLRAFVIKLQDEIIRDKGVVARIGGDVFSALFLRELTDDVTQYLSGSTVQSEDGGISRLITTHAGYYKLSDRCHTRSELSEILDEALRRARKHIDNVRYAFCDDEVIAKLREVRRIEGMFRKAVENEEFIVYYQPKVETKRYRMRGAEALCRWIHEGEMILPFRFIPVYENNGYICELDFYMLEHVCQDIRRWLDEGKKAVCVSVNFSREHIGDHHLVEHIVELVDRYRVPHQYIEVELTETSSEVDYMELREIVAGLHAAGIHTSIDDFGVGYSSMNLLAELPWDMVKIDRSFVPVGSEDEEDKKKVVMLKSIVTMAQALKMECIAEGVETVQQMLLLKEYGCFLIQGYFFDRPMPVNEFEERLAILTSIS